MPYQLIELNTPATENLLAHIANMLLLIGQKNNIFSLVNILCLSQWIWVLNMPQMYLNKACHAVSMKFMHMMIKLDMWQELTSSRYPQYYDL